MVSARTEVADAARPEIKFHVELATQTALEWLARTRHADVLHVFERVCNLVNKEGDVLALVTTLRALGPFALLIPDRLKFSDTLRIADPVTVEEGSLRLGVFAIDSRRANEWHATPRWESLRAQRATVRAHTDGLRSLLAEHAPGDSIAKSLGLIPDTDEARSAKRTSKSQPVNSIRRRYGIAYQAREQILHGIVNGDNESLHAGASALAGLGPGLTPAGDDYLMGIMFGLHATRERADAARLSQAIAQSAIPHTNTLSAAWLRAAAQGETSVSWHPFAEALIDAGDAALWQTALAVLDTGHTSGADALAGFIEILESAIEPIASATEVHQT